ncbi:hypothetical protein M378DRAFT_107697 [Amanita muscaria Koide BX008]|uniref:F-box domain-containing protein n=1 Tax=Amanita muscaria (strain Koide BX008) TaxID=946122 RepID=A0A0C2X2Y5_AMAMK|nr:hypothetical protein M378DRAFT_107697 [Amanita muscaria Koide BX008]
MGLAALQQHAAMQRVILIPELLDMIFSYLDISDNANNARVCKQWCDVALDTLWREVDDFSRLFSLLAPLCYNEDLEYRFSRLPESTDWKRFERYSRRVRRLCYRSQDTGAKGPLAQSMFDDIARTRTSFAILPNMHTLEWEGQISLCVMFMHPNVRRFTVRLPPVSDPISVDASLASLASDSSQTSVSQLPSTLITSFFADIVDRMPNLTYLNLRLAFPMSRIASDVTKLLRGLPRLKKFGMPRYCVTTEVMNALSKLEFLGSVEFQYTEEQGCGDPEDVTEFEPTPEEGAFPALWDLSLAVGYRNFARFINASFAPTNLRCLHLDSHFFEAPEDIKSLLVILSENCQLLHTLALISRVDVQNVGLDLDPADELCITSDCLKPLLKFSNLVSFELVHSNPVYINQNDIEELAEQWPSLESLMLNNEPGFINHTCLSLEALLPFARHCPRLKHLGLFLNASTLGQSYQSTPTSSLTPTKLIRPPSNPPRFKCLKRLSMGVSPISDVNGVVLFLSSMCPMDCAVESGVTWDDNGHVGSGMARAIRIRCDRWTRVEEMLPGMVELRFQERERAKQLEVENEDLRIRNSVLLDKLGLTPPKGRPVPVTEDSCVTA